MTDATIFQDIEKLSEGRVKVPEGMELGQISHDANFSRPGLNLGFGRNRSRSRKRKK